MKKTDPKHSQTQIGMTAFNVTDAGHSVEVISGHREESLNRRGFLNRLSLASLTAAIGAEIVFADKMPTGLIPAAFAQGSEPLSIPGKDGLSIFNNRPMVA